MIKIGKLKIGTNYPPLVIAEMSGNHNQSLDKALDIVDNAAKSGAHMIKIQTYTADTLTIKSKRKDFFINDKKSLWKNHTLYDLYSKAYTPWEWHKDIFLRAKKNNILCFSSPFDETAVDFLETLNIPVYKVASFEITNLPLIKKISKKNKPIIMSTGMATLSEIEEAVAVAKNNGCNEVILLKCTSTYPSDPKNSNLKTIHNLREIFNCEVGISDHTLGIGASIASIALGASIIEKHFTLDRSEGGVDSKFSLEPNEMKSLVKESKRAWQAIGKVTYGPTDEEKPSIKFKKSIYVTSNIEKNEKFSKNNIRIIRPGYGISPKYYDQIIGSKAKIKLELGTPLQWKNILNK